MTETFIHTMISKQDIIDAYNRVSPFTHRTPVLTSSGIHTLAGCDLFFKCENFQKVGAFKMRGAMNAVLSLTDEELKKGIATHSSGNHAQAVALAAKRKGTKAFIVMPTTAPVIKKKAVLAYGGDITECAPTLESRESTLAAVVKKTGAVEVHPYNNEHVITGQATAAKELIEDVNDLDFIVTPVGGGGLISGTALTANYFSSSTQVIGGEPSGADDACRSLQSGKIEPSQANSIADGLLSSLGTKTFPIIQEHVKEIITVTDEEIVIAMRLIWERMKIIVEPSAAVPLAAVLRNKKQFKDKRVGVILTGGNVDLEKVSGLFQTYNK